MARRSKEERIIEIDEKIAYYQTAIEKLEAKKHDILNPKKKLTKAEKMAIILDEASKSMSPEEMATKLGLQISE